MGRRTWFIQNWCFHARALCSGIVATRIPGRGSTGRPHSRQHSRSAVRGAVCPPPPPPPPSVPPRSSTAERPRRRQGSAAVYFFPSHRDPNPWATAARRNYYLVSSVPDGVFSGISYTMCTRNPRWFASGKETRVVKTVVSPYFH